MNGLLKDVFSVEIEQITPAGKYIYKGSTETHSKAYLYTNILYDYIQKKADEDKVTVTFGDKSEQTIDTHLGKRHVTVQEITIESDDSIDYETVYYGDKGLIYYREIKLVSTEDNMEMSGTLKYMDSSLVS